MTESMIERVARAIMSKVPVGYGMTDDEAVEYARAAIEAMREPTDAMVDAGADMIDDRVRTVNGKPESPNDVAYYTYVTMIDAALLEQQP